jgi:hypothetical protein
MYENGETSETPAAFEQNGRPLAETEEARPLIKQLRVRRCALATRSVVASGQFHICDSITPIFDVQQINRFWSELDSIGKG